jgi:hypothetical protein
MAAATIRRQFIVERFDRLADSLRPPWLFFPCMMALVLLPALGIASLADLAGEPEGGARHVAEGLLKGGVLQSIIIGILLGPLVENAILWTAIAAIRMISRSGDLAIVAGAAIMAALHVPGGVGRALAIAWPFLVWGAVLSSSRFKSKTRAFATVYALHVANNVVTIGALYVIAGAASI